jgi:glycolate oxidase FAD binding subunit
VASGSPEGGAQRNEPEGALSAHPPPGLKSACGDEYVRAGGAADAVGGLLPRWVAAPGGADALADVLRVAADVGLTVVARGAGTKLDWGTPPSRLDLIVDTGRLAGVHKHAAGDLVAIVGAGTPLRAVQAALGEAGQRVALDPPSRSATVGGVVATGESGPLRLQYGTPRDLLIGVEFVRADGVMAHSGGQVVKNVAGYDLGKLMCGSYGTLGVVTSATLRLHPVPASRLWVRRTVRSPLEVHDLVGRVLASPLAAAAIEVDLPAGAAAHARVPRPRLSGSGESGTLAVLFEGSTAGVTARAGAIAGLLGSELSTVDEAPSWWGRYPFGPTDVALKLVAPIADLYAGIYALRDAAGSPVPVRGSVGSGVVYAALPGTLSPARVATLLSAVRTTLMARGGSCVVLSAPSRIRAGIDIWGPVPGLPLMRRVKDQFDPRRTLAPGRMVGGI